MAETVQTPMHLRPSVAAYAYWKTYQKTHPNIQLHQFLELMRRTGAWNMSFGPMYQDVEFAIKGAKQTRSYYSTSEYPKWRMELQRTIARDFNVAPDVLSVKTDAGVDIMELENWMLRPSIIISMSVPKGTAYNVPTEPVAPIRTSKRLVAVDKWIMDLAMNDTALDHIIDADKTVEQRHREPLSELIHKRLNERRDVDYDAIKTLAELTCVNVGRVKQYLPMLIQRQFNYFESKYAPKIQEALNASTADEKAKRRQELSSLWSNMVVNAPNVVISQLRQLAPRSIAFGLIKSIIFGPSYKKIEYSQYDRPTEYSSESESESESGSESEPEVESETTPKIEEVDAMPRQKSARRKADGEASSDDEYKPQMKRRRASGMAVDSKNLPTPARIPSDDEINAAMIVESKPTTPTTTTPVTTTPALAVDAKDSSKDKEKADPDLYKGMPAASSPKYAPVLDVASELPVAAKYPQDHAAPAKPEEQAFAVAPIDPKTGKYKATTVQRLKAAVSKTYRKKLKGKKRAAKTGLQAPGAPAATPTPSAPAYAAPAYTAPPGASASEVRALKKAAKRKGKLKVMKKTAAEKETKRKLKKEKKKTKKAAAPAAAPVKSKAGNADIQKEVEEEYRLIKQGYAEYVKSVADANKNVLTSPPSSPTLETMSLIGSAAKNASPFANIPTKLQDRAQELYTIASVGQKFREMQAGGAKPVIVIDRKLSDQDARNQWSKSAAFPAGNHATKFNALDGQTTYEMKGNILLINGKVCFVPPEVVETEAAKFIFRDVGF